MAASIFDVNTQLTFYAYLRSAQVLLADILTPEFLPNIHHEFNEYLAFDMNIPAVFSAFYIAYYFILEPFAALLYTPQLTLSLLTATAFAARPDHITVGATYAGSHNSLATASRRSAHQLFLTISWEVYRPSDLAVVLAPFFVHLEILFALGYRPQMHKRINNEIGKEIARIKKIEGDKRRAAAAKAQ
ncbi:duf962 domain-containing protein [Moniliophthora roreri]|nr:duf962 domain-containing protein [Moniliophthora roreri]